MSQKLNQAQRKVNQLQDTRRCPQDARELSELEEKISGALQLLARTND